MTAIYGPSDMWRAATGSKLKYWPSIANLWSARGEMNERL